MKYIICSFGGSGSTILSKWLNKIGPSFHIHSLVCPSELCEPILYNKGNGVKTCDSFSNIPVENIDEYKVIFIYRKPSEAVTSMLSRFNYRDIERNLDATSEDKLSGKSLEVYMKKGKDLLKIGEHFSNWTNSDTVRNYDLVLVNYHKLWDSVEEFLEALDLDSSLVESFPKCRESKRLPNENLQHIYQDLDEEILKKEAVIVLKRK